MANETGKKTQQVRGILYQKCKKIYSCFLIIRIQKQEGNGFLFN